MSGVPPERRRAGRALRWAFGVLLALAVLAEFVVERKAHFAIESVFGFGAWFGFLACAALIVIAKAAGLLLKRGEDYYPTGDADRD